MAREKLKGMYNEEDYPELEEVRKKFTFKSNFLPFPETTDFRLEMADEELAELSLGSRGTRQ